MIEIVQAEHPWLLSDGTTSFNSKIQNIAPTPTQHMESQCRYEARDSYQQQVPQRVTIIRFMHLHPPHTNAQSYET
jgi:hypothetical protein